MYSEIPMFQLKMYLLDFVTVETVRIIVVNVLWVLQEPGGGKELSYLHLILHLTCTVCKPANTLPRCPNLFQNTTIALCGPSQTHVLCHWAYWNCLIGWAALSHSSLYFVPNVAQQQTFQRTVRVHLYWASFNSLLFWGILFLAHLS